MFKNILATIDLNDEPSCRKPLLSAVELTRAFSARLYVLTVVRDVEAILQANATTLGATRLNDAACNQAVRSVWINVQHQDWRGRA